MGNYGRLGELRRAMDARGRVGDAV